MKRKENTDYSRHTRKGEENGKRQKEERKKDRGTKMDRGEKREKERREKRKNEERKSNEKGTMSYLLSIYREIHHSLIKCLSNYLSFYPCTYPSTSLTLLSQYPSISLSLYRSPFIYPSIYFQSPVLPIYLFIYCFPST